MGNDFQKSALPTLFKFSRVRATHKPHVSWNTLYHLVLVQERALGEALCYFIEYGLLLLQHHRKLFTPKNKLAFEKLDFLLR